MNPSSLTLERLEFSQIHIESNSDYKLPDDQSGPQLSFSFDGVNFRRRSLLRYPPEEAADPKHFFCMFGFRVAKEDQKDKVIPYEIDVEVTAFFTYLDDSLNGANRFRGVRLSAYQMLYGALREMVSNLTARSTFGMLQLPSADFREAARLDSEADEKRRQERLAKLQRGKASETAEDVDAKVTPKKTARKRIAKKISKEQ
ncbi:hypothetical protein [Burkholderia ubonensis]|uniref:hypothetical protein n=1 Tax=Burkholderia ubonensis TaxID=101571 RepID=UPI000B21FD05|nr:hypothetical protein [Burkholderia ubonensis]